MSESVGAIFIGGPIDGDRRIVEARMVHVVNSLSWTGALNVELHRYRHWREVKQGTRGIEVAYLYEKLDEAEALGKLIESYRPK